MTRGHPQMDTAVNIVFYGDMASDLFPRAAGTIQRILEEPSVDVIIHAGDLSYSMGFQFMWEWFFKVIEPAATRIPYMVSVGNHEYDEVSTKSPTWHPIWGNFGDDSGGECGVPVKKKFQMPDNGRFWYSFKYGNVHVVMMSTEHDWTSGSEQYTWLEKDLKSVDRSVTPWVILTGHRPMYTSIIDDGEQSVAAHMRQWIEPLLLKFHVNLCLWGHIHYYERSCPVYQGVCQSDSKAPVHATVGTGGTDLGFGISNFNETWDVAHDIDWGYFLIHANASDMHLQFKVNLDGHVSDEFWLHQW